MPIPRRHGDGRREPSTARPPPDGHDVSGPATDDAMTRSKEELRVGPPRASAGARACASTSSPKQVQTTVPVAARRGPRRARADHRRQHRPGHVRPAISEEEHEVVLHEEEVVVEKRVVPKERVRPRKGHGHRGAAGLRRGAQGADRRRHRPRAGARTASPGRRTASPRGRWPATDGRPSIGRPLSPYSQEFISCNHRCRERRRQPAAGFNSSSASCRTCSAFSSSCSSATSSPVSSRAFSSRCSRRSAWTRPCAPDRPVSTSRESRPAPARPG